MISLAIIEKQIACAEREVKKREQVYPRLIEANKLTRERAAEEIATMRGIATTLLAVRGLLGVIEKVQLTTPQRVDAARCAGAALYAHLSRMGANVTQIVRCEWAIWELGSLCEDPPSSLETAKSIAMAGALFALTPLAETTDLERIAKSSNSH